MRILLFAGTTEGRRLVQNLSSLPVSIYVSTATEYGKECVEAGTNVEVMAGRMDEREISDFIQMHKIDIVVDATHPFARVVSENIRNACSAGKKEYVRCLREKQDMSVLEAENVVFKSSVKEAAEYLKGTAGKVFISTGSKELKLYTQIENYQDRCYARVLSTPEAVQESAEHGFKASHLIAMQGPFSKELNTAMLRATGARYFVTKESGKAGGFQEKAEAAEETGAVLVVITRPEESGISSKETLEYIKGQLFKGGSMEKSY